ncbi:hypothetical protein PTUN_b0421 [Pseudoalteromonas tunicata]|jgi:polar amino acid transport system substrate-binding protein|uniref:Probable ABC transporter, periplasmic substrate-binding protein n=2 Tax=Pseudoalteromonas tunicata TaxID=314281 RepID=A4C585_9GAMM|nr:transporter substrate-binding domain-containing protein [Pseudoalteromonas tunicata]ATC96810.1 hypothetical protein PTUN_b0421 [Pseudoalteromonas tunicata]AXT32954.1 ABC transporter substrate-binding protein [Pseudoalteromonas tunicata]EAR30717.1 probable ABC transporter, periplasmic substrate-binding protein [Pseudoalteromonas tunicata D2]MDP5214750.1 transporter substrate-binding domain-containing protein [Pseudoalteromonas tunicata]
MIKHFIIVLFYCSFCLSLVLSMPSAAKSQSLTVAIDHSPPYSYFDDKGRPSGLIVDVFQEISRSFNYDFKFVECPWARCVKLVSEGQIDLLAGITKTAEREQIFAFIEPAFFKRENHFKFYYTDKNLTIDNVADLAPLTVGMLRGALHTKAFDNDQTLSKETFVDVQSLFNALQKGRVDAIIHSDQVIQPYLAQYDHAHTIYSSTLSLPAKSEGFIALSKKSPHIALQAQLSEVLAELENKGTLATLLSRYKF